MLNLFIQIIQIPIGEQLGDFFAFGPNGQGLGALVSRAVDVFIVFAVVVSLLMILMSGISWITAGGNKDQMETARNRLTNALIGLAVTMSAWAIWLLIVKQFFGLDVTGGLNLGG